MQNKPLNIEPFQLTTAVANILNCAIGSLAGPVGYTQTQPYILLRHIRANNKDTVPHTITLYKGATAGSAGGTEFAFANVIIPAQQSVDWYAGAGGARFDSADFLTGIDATTANKVTLNMEADIGVS
jgi:hypothetical protein